MADRSKDKDQKPIFDAELPKDEELDDESDESAEAEGAEVDAEGVDAEGDAEDEGFEEAAPSGKSGGAFRFSLRRGRNAEDEATKRDDQIGSVRTAHERVHIDDRPSAVYALVCAVALLVMLALPWIGGAIPKAAGPTLTPLVVPTGHATPTGNASASATIVVTPSPTAAASASASGQ